MTPNQEEYPPQVSLVKDVYRPFPSLPINLASAAELDAPALVNQALTSLTGALRANDAAQLQSSFLGSQAYWRDLLAFTWHIRTFNDGPLIAPSLLTLARQRGWDGRLEVDPESVNHVTVSSPASRFIEAHFAFETASPAAECAGRVMLMPEDGDNGSVVWKIWCLNTWVEGLKDFPEDEERLKAPRREMEREEVIETEVFVVGGGNA